MDIKYYPVTVESYTGGERVLWDWSVTTDDGKVLTGMEPSEFAAKFYVIVAVIRFMFSKPAK